VSFLVLYKRCTHNPVNQRGMLLHLKQPVKVKGGHIFYDSELTIPLLIFI